MLVINKINKYSISVQNKSNKIIGSTKDNFNGIRPGTYIKFGDVDVLYSILDTKKFFFSKEFEIINPRQIKLPSNIGIYLQKEDEIKITYDEFKLDYIINIVKGGSFYSVGDILIINEGVPSTSLEDGSVNYTKLLVEEVNPDGGAITKLSLLDSGKYVEPPNGLITLSGGTGSGLIINAKYNLMDEKNIDFRIIKDIIQSPSETILVLDYPLSGIQKRGVFSLEKYEIQLTSPYLGATQSNVDCKIFQDFTPNYQLPLSVKNNEDVYLILNDALLKIDSILKKIESKIISS